MPDSTEYGWVFTDSDTKVNLYNSNRDYYGEKTFEKLYNQATVSAQASLDVAQKNYQNSLVEAYASAMGSKSALAQTNLYGEAKEAQIADINAAMQSAFNTYQNNLLAQEQTINEKYQQNISAIDTALTQQAENYNALAGSAYEYLQYLYDEYDMSGDDENNIFANDKLWSRYTTIDEDGARRLKTWQELVKGEGMTDAGEYTGLFDDKGNLTIKGSEFFDQMFNEVSVAGKGGKYKYGQGYWEWLNETNPELKAWAQSSNPYDYNAAGTNIGSFKEDVGLLSTDETYRFMERFGGFTAEEAKSMYAEFESEISKLMSDASGEKGKNKGRDITKDTLSLSNKLQDYCDKLGIPLTNDDWQAINSELQRYIAGTKTMGQMAGDWFGTTFTTTATMTGTGAALGSVVPGVGTGAGAVAGVIIGGLGGIITASIATDEQRKANQKNAKDATARLNEVLVYLTNYASEQQKSISSDYKSKYGIK